MIRTAAHLVLDTLTWVFCFVYLISPGFVRDRMDRLVGELDG